MFDIGVQPLGANVAPTEDGVELTVVLGIPMPFQDPQNPGNPLMAPMGQVRIPLAREFGISLGKKIAEECEKLPKESNLTVASSLHGVEQIANLDKQFKG